MTPEEKVFRNIVVTPKGVMTRYQYNYPDTSDYYLWNPTNFTVQKYIDKKVKNIKAKENYDNKKVRERIYRTVMPYGYGINDMLEAERSYNENINRQYARQGIRAGLFGLEDEQGDIREAQWAKYLGLPTFTYNYFNDGLRTDSVKNKLTPAKYSPKKGKVVGDLVRMPPHESLNHELSDKVLAALYRSAQRGDSIVPLANSPTLGRYTGSIGKDSLGNYISYYDEWDLNPFQSAGYSRNESPLSLFVPKSVYSSPDIFQKYEIGHPFSLYDRRYYSDYELKNALSKYDEKRTDLILKQGRTIGEKTNERIR